jgi:TonB family protein
VKDWVPMPPYGPVRHVPARERKSGTDKPTKAHGGIDFTRPPQPIGKVSKNEATPTEGTQFIPNDDKNGETIDCAWCGIPSGTGKGPAEPIVEIKKGPRVVQMTKIDPAMLKHRVEPVYPALARQMRRSGRVEMRARIGTDGRIESLQIVLSDPIFDQSAINAVQEWIYKPTILNGQAVEVDTYITVIYSSQQ